jgi:hypothetical protein
MTRVAACELAAAAYEAPDPAAGSAYPLQSPRLDPWCDEIAEPRADVELRSKCCASLLHVDDDADRSPANLGRSVRLIESNFGADAEVHDPTIPAGRRLVNARSAAPPKGKPRRLQAGPRGKGAREDKVLTRSQTDDPQGVPSPQL